VLLVSCYGIRVCLCVVVAACVARIDRDKALGYSLYTLLAVVGLQTST
jgi:hypothetical protein